MPIDSSSMVRVSSPSNGGRASPSNARSRQKDDDGILKKDKNYRRYTSTVERVLAQFTAVEEWADYISFLGRLLKALSAGPAGLTETPHKALVAKRLSQCLNPVLPSGVHQKAIEVYAFIFSSIGKDGLAADLSLYLPGLAPTLSFASLSVKPNILTLFESHMVKLDSVALRPALKALILSLLPSLEEGNSEEFEWTLRILNTLKAAVSGAESSDSPTDQYFWQCFFLASITSSSRRPGALAYLIRNLPNLGSKMAGSQARRKSHSTHITAPEEDVTLQHAIKSVATPEPGLLIRCFCTGLRDEQLLIQRGFLDLLVTHLPLHSVVLQEKTVPEDLKRLIAAATSVVARRDMSLNRRLWSWFLGPEPSIDAAAATSPTTPRSAGAFTPRQEILTAQSHYFEQYGLSPLVRSITAMIDDEPEGASERTRPLRVCLSLMDRWEIGSLIVPQIFLPALRSVWRYQSLQVSKDARAEVLRSANMFFDAVESSLIWAELAKVISQALDPNGNYPETQFQLEFVLFVISNFNIREEEMQVVHMPLVSLFVLLRLQSLVRQSQPAFSENSEHIATALGIVSKLLDLIPSRVLKADYDNKSKPDSIPKLDPKQETEIVSSIESFYAKEHGNIDIKRPWAEKDVGRLLLSSCFALIAPLLNPNIFVTAATIDLMISILGIVIRKGPRSVPNMEDFIALLRYDLRQPHQQEKANQRFSVTSAKVTALETIFTTPQSAEWMPMPIVRQCIPGLVTDLWPGLSPCRLKYNVEAARSFWRLQAIGKDHKLIESTIVSLMNDKNAQYSDETLNLESARRLTTLWAHSQATPSGANSRRSSAAPSRIEAVVNRSTSSELAMLERPLMLLLDSLEQPRAESSIFAVNWLQSLPTLLPIISALNHRIAGSPFAQAALSESFDNGLGTTGQSNDMETCLYYLQTTLNVIQVSPVSIWDALACPHLLAKSEDSPTSNLEFLLSVCLSILEVQDVAEERFDQPTLPIKQVALALLGHMLTGPLSSSLVEKELEIPLLDKLIWATQQGHHTLQISLMEVLLPALQMKYPTQVSTKSAKQDPRHTRNDSRIPSNLETSAGNGDRRARSSESSPLPHKLLDCLLLGMKSVQSRPVLESWISFLRQCLPLYEEAIFVILLPLVECFCTTLGAVLEDIQATFGTVHNEATDVSEPTTALLLNGLEQTLATAHDFLGVEEAGLTPIKSPEHQQTGFFGNMVSGVFTNETNRSKTMTANKRLTVLLCFKDAIRVCFQLWLWGDSGKDSSLRDASASASFNYISLRLRNRTRRLFEHLFAVEPLECLETLVELWQGFSRAENTQNATVVLNLLNALENSRPKNTIPAIFNAIYSRTNPSVLESNRKSTLTSDLADTSLSAFLVKYARSLEDDAMDEIWTDCLTFLRDVLTNPMPHRQALARLLEFTSVLGGKVDGTNFGEQRKMRRDLGDLFIRLLTASLTIRPMGFSFDIVPAQNTEKLSVEPGNARSSFDGHDHINADDIISILASIAPNLPKILIEAERIASTASMISAQVLIPVFRAKSFPANVNQRTLDLMIALSSIPEASKASKKDAAEAFNDPKFFSTPASLAQSGWLPIIRSWVLADKERMPDLLSRFSSPTAAGFLGVGATSARLEADRRTQLNLRRIAVLILASRTDTFVVNLAGIQSKLVDLMEATVASSPSSVTRAEIYMVIRALVLKTSIIHLSSFWPTVNAELFDALSAVHTSEAEEPLSSTCVLHACKLLDTILALGLDDFQMQEWLFISDTTDAVYRPPDLVSVALVDGLAESLDSDAGDIHERNNSIVPVEASSDKRRPLLMAAATRDVPPEKLMETAIRPFLRQLSIHTFESTYGMQPPDWDACFEDLVVDLFDDTTLV